MAIGLRADFAHDGVERFACAYSAHTTDFAFTPHQAPVVGVRAEVLMLEAHDADRHLMGLREIFFVNGRLRLSALHTLHTAERGGPL